MAWIELRRRRYVVIDRVEGVKAKGPSYDTRADAEAFLELVALAGWPAALDFVNQEPFVVVLAEDDTTSRATRERAVAAGAVADPLGLPLTDPSLPPPPGREPSGVSVGELVRQYIQTCTARPRTLQQYAAYVRDHVDPYFGDLDAAYVIRQLKPKAEGTRAMAVADWRAWMLAKPVMAPTGKPTGSTLSGKTVKNIMALVSSAFDVAMNDDFDRLVAYNPVTGMAPRSTAADDIERVFLSPRQFQDLREHTIDHYLNLLLFMVLTGLRWGEAGGLRVRDVCLAPESGRPYLEVRVALKRIKGGTVLGLLKSKAARRRLTIPEVLVPVITGAIAGKDLDACVFTSPEGKRLHHGNVTRNLDKAIVRARAAGSDLPDFRLHALRHSCAAWLLSAGRTPYQVSRQLGHETEATTQKYYGHLVRTEYDTNADVLQQALDDAGWDLPAHVSVEVMASAADAGLIELATSDVIGDEAELETAA